MRMGKFIGVYLIGVIMYLIPRKQSMYGINLMKEKGLKSI